MTHAQIIGFLLHFGLHAGIGRNGHKVRHALGLQSRDPSQRMQAGSGIQHGTKGTRTLLFFNTTKQAIVLAIDQARW